MRHTLQSPFGSDEKVGPDYIYTSDTCERCVQACAFCYDVFFLNVCILWIWRLTRD